MFPQPFFVRDQQGGRVRTLVIVQDQLVDARGMLYQGFLYTLRTVFLPVASDQQALETPQHIKKPVMHISHIPGVQPTLLYGIGRRCRVLPVAGHHVLSPDDDLAFLPRRKYVAVHVADL